MAEVARPLTALEVQRLETPGLHAVGTVPGLYLRVLPPPSTAKVWALRLVVNGKRRELGLGGYPAVSLAEAVASARDRRMAALGGQDPADRPSAGRRTRLRSASSRPVTFAQAAEAYISVHAAGWKHPLHAVAVASLARAARLSEDRRARRPGHRHRRGPQRAGADLACEDRDGFEGARPDRADPGVGLQARRDRSPQSGSMARASRHAASRPRKDRDTSSSHGAAGRRDAALHESAGQGGRKRSTCPGVRDPDRGAVG